MELLDFSQIFEPIYPNFLPFKIFFSDLKISSLLIVITHFVETKETQNQSQYLFWYMNEDSLSAMQMSLMMNNHENACRNCLNLENFRLNIMFPPSWRQMSAHIG